MTKHIIELLRSKWQNVRGESCRFLPFGGAIGECSPFVSHVSVTRTLVAVAIRFVNVQI